MGFPFPGQVQASARLLKLQDRVAPSNSTTSDRVMEVTQDTTDHSL